jgi:hypothetical protein
VKVKILFHGQVKTQIYRKMKRLFGCLFVLCLTFVRGQKDLLYTNPLKEVNYSVLKPAFSETRTEESDNSKKRKRSGKKEKQHSKRSKFQHERKQDLSSESVKEKTSTKKKVKAKKEISLITLDRDIKRKDNVDKPFQKGCIVVDINTGDEFKLGKRAFANEKRLEFFLIPIFEKDTKFRWNTEKGYERWNYILSFRPYMKSLVSEKDFVEKARRKATISIQCLACNFSSDKSCM